MAVITEEDLERELVQILKEDHGYRVINAAVPYGDTSSDDGSGRQSRSEVVLKSVLLEKVAELNPAIPAKDRQRAVEERLLVSRRAMSPLLASKEIYQMIRDGIPLEYEGEKGKKESGTLRLIDFQNGEKNDFLAVRQLNIKGDRYTRIPDVLLYINGLPLVYIELKNSNVKIENAYTDNLTNCRNDIPRLFDFNAFCILSNAVETRVGSSFADWKFFFSWLRVDDETEKVDRKAIEREGTSIERVIGGLLGKERLLDYIENFILYHKDTAKIIAKNHQFHGVNKAVASFADRKVREGRLGVFWHTQGSGKSYSMIFLSRKIHRKFTGNFTFLIITDRTDLDGQIYGNFVDTDTVKKSDAARPTSSMALREDLVKNKPFIFTLIQKFQSTRGKEFPILHDSTDSSREIIVIVDEAHRTQYLSLAENMRRGLPGAHYFAFTGTPLLAGSEKGKTQEWFGGYVSEYSYVQSIEDEATLPLYYEKRVPEVLIENPNLSEDFAEIVEDEQLNTEQRERLENKFAKELEVIRRDDRLETIARDIAYHFPRRGYLGKGMVISVDKYTAVRMYEKVKHHWEIEKRNIQKAMTQASEVERQALKRSLDFMRNTQMAVVLSEEVGEKEKFAAKGLEIESHRKLLNTPNEEGQTIEDRFKKEDDPLNLVFVCAMWLTGFDAPSVSTLYLDKPMKGHTLMQTLARANRVTGHLIYGRSKTNGEVIDYYNVFRNMQQALSDYATGSEGQTQKETEATGEDVIPSKSNLFELLDAAIEEGVTFLSKHDIDLMQIPTKKSVLKQTALFKEFSDTLLADDLTRQEFFLYESAISSLYDACRPEVTKERARPIVPLFSYLREMIEAIIKTKDIDSAVQRVSALLDESVVTTEEGILVKEPAPEYQIRQKGKVWDLSKLDFEQLKNEFKTKPHKNIEITVLKEFLIEKLDRMMRENGERAPFVERLQSIIENYNSGTVIHESTYEELVNFASDLKVEEERHIRENLTPDELELFDLLKKEKMTKDEEIDVKKAAKALLHRLKEERPKVLVQDWFRDSTSLIRVKEAVTDILEETLPDSYDRALFSKKCERTFEVIRTYAEKGEKWVA